MQKQNAVRHLELPYWVTPIARLYYSTIVLPYQGKLISKRNVQKQDVIAELLSEFQQTTPVDKRGLEMLYDRAEARGYMPKMIYIGLKTLICKNFIRTKYVSPNNNPLLEVIHERMYMEDWEFRQLFARKI